MGNAVAVDRLQFAFTITFHYIFPQLAMGLALLLVILKTIALRTGDENYNHAARFWARIFAINFTLGAKLVIGSQRSLSFSVPGCPATLLLRAYRRQKRQGG